MTTTIPQVLDAWKRVSRTVVQVVLAFLSFAAIFPAIVAAVGAPHGSNIAVWLATAGTWVTIVAGVLTRVMAIPAVNALLTQIGLGGHSGNVAANDSWTTAVPTITTGTTATPPAAEPADTVAPATASPAATSGD